MTSSFISAVCSTICVFSNMDIMSLYGISTWHNDHLQVKTVTVPINIGVISERLQLWCRYLWCCYSSTLASQSLFVMVLGYLLSKVEEKVGSPERPLSDLGLISYRSYWKEVLLRYMCNFKGKEISIKGKLSFPCHTRERLKACSLWHLCHSPFFSRLVQRSVKRRQWILWISSVLCSHFRCSSTGKGSIWSWSDRYQEILSFIKSTDV